MSDWITANADLRKTLSDGPTDKLRHRKKVIGKQDGVNNTFKTFEMRRITTLVGAAAPLGVYKNNALVTVLSEDVESGEFVVDPSGIPSNTDVFVATYYVQWFLDSELDEFLLSAATWTGYGSNVLTVPDDFRPAAKEFAAALAYQKLCAKFAENLSETYQLQDAPDAKRFDPVQAYMKIASEKMKLAEKLRNDVYERKGQSKAPISATIRGGVRDVPPNR